MQRSSFSRFAWGVLGYNLLVILWGAWVRVTGSGAGCGSHWPLCNGEVVPRDPSLETLIEYSHRLTSGLALLAVIALPILARRIFPQGHRVRRAAVASLVLMLIEAGIGAGLVLFELVADNASMARAMFMATHLGNTFLLLGAITLTAYWGSGGAAVVRPFAGRLATLLWLALASTVVVGMSGAVAALGDTLFPASSLAEGLRQDLSATSHLLVRLRLWHPFLAFAASILLLYVVGTVRKQKRPQPARRFANALNLLVLVQLTVGGLNVVLLAPGWMQLVHLLLADLLWISLVLTAAASLTAEGRVREPSRDLEPAGGGVRAVSA